MGCNDEELFPFFLESSDAAPSAPLHAPLGKALAKGKRGSASRPAGVLPTKRARLQEPTPTTSTPGDPLLAALSDIKLSLGDMVFRIAILEAGAAMAPVPAKS